MSTEKVSDTPRTDAARLEWEDLAPPDYYRCPYVNAEVATQLERELSLSQEETSEVIKFSRQVELELRDWQRLQLWGGTPAVVEAFIKGQQNRIHTCQELEQELTAWKECAKGLLRALVVRIDSGNTQVDEWEGFALAEFGRLNGEPAPTTEVDKLKGAPPSP